MTDRPTFASLAYDSKKRKTRREKFLAEMDRVIPWAELLKIIRKHYPRAGNGRQPMPLERMLRIYFLQQWYGLSDPGMEDELYDSESIRRFARIELESDVIPDETTILNFRHLLEKHGLTERIFERTKQYLADKGLLLRQGTIVDATIINAPSSTKNMSGRRDEEMKQTKKGNQWYFGMKAHVGTDSRRGLAHRIVVTSAAVHDSQVMDDLLNGEETSVYGDKAYTSKEKKEMYQSRGIEWHIDRKGAPGHKLSQQDHDWNREQHRTRAKGEHIFRIVKHLWGYRKVRYKGLLKNAVQVFSLFSLANLYMVRKDLLMMGA
ncbi:MAG: IS5 family transposase [Methanosarcinaceae archaeon]|nr:IS5 family transposase [Methanosarcinaceae archaeon]